MSPRRLRAVRTGQRTVYLSEAVYQASRKAAERHPYCSGNWSMYVEIALRAMLEAEKEARREVVP